jgi:hypothetical protein
MRTIRRTLFLFTMALALTPGASLAQGIGAASMAGVVKDASGAVLPGVTVEASSPVLIEKVRTTVPTPRARISSPSCAPVPTA